MEKNICAICSLVPTVFSGSCLIKYCTFRFAQSKRYYVQVTGDFLPTKKIQTFGEFDGPGVAISRRARTASGNLLHDVLALNLSYSFIVDGSQVADPANVYMNRDVNLVTNIFIIKGGRGDLVQCQ